jgi:hypothetical protein
MALDQTSFEAALKQLYPSEAIKNLVYMRNPAYALIPKDESFGGESSKEPITIGTPQNRSAQFASANVFNTTSIIKAFLLTRVSNYSMASIANETILASESDKGAFLKAAKFEIDNALLALTRSIATQLYRNGTGSVARIAASATINSAGTPIALSNPEDIVNLELGMAIAFSATDGGAAKTGTAYIVNISRSAGTIQVSATYGGSPAALTALVGTAAVSDYIYASAGDINNVMKGFQAWLPGSAVTNTAFFGVDRSVDTRLAGITYDGSAQSIEEALIDAAGLVAREGGNPDHCFVSYKDFRNLVKAVGSKMQVVQYSDVKVEEPGVSVGFSALMLVGPNGPMKVIPDQNCPAGKAFLLQMDTWKLKTLGEAVRLFDTDGLRMLRDPAADAVQIRCFSYGQVSCRAPGYNCVVTLP